MPYWKVRRTLINQRNKNQHRPGGEVVRTFDAFSKHMSSPELPQSVLQDDNGLPLQCHRIEHDSGGLMLIFHNGDHIGSLRGCEWLFIDGTFKVLPQMIGLNQLLVVHAMKKDQVILTFNVIIFEVVMH